MKLKEEKNWSISSYLQLKWIFVKIKLRFFLTTNFESLLIFYIDCSNP